MKLHLVKARPVRATVRYQGGGGPVQVGGVERVAPGDAEPVRRPGKRSVRRSGDEQHIVAADGETEEAYRVGRASEDDDAIAVGAIKGGCGRDRGEKGRLRRGPEAGARNRPSRVPPSRMRSTSVVPPARMRAPARPRSLASSTLVALWYLKPRTSDHPSRRSRSTDRIAATVPHRLRSGKDCRSCIADVLHRSGIGIAYDPACAPHLFHFDKSSTLPTF